jgi:hypothetical protein
MKTKLKKLWNGWAISSMWHTFFNDNSDKVISNRGRDILENFEYYKIDENNHIKVNGEQLIGRAREVWDRIDHEGLDWKSFVNGWLEGRLDLIESRAK